MHGISDLLEYTKLQVVKGIKYFTFAMAFVWYGVGFYLHSFLYKDSPVEVTIQSMPVLLMISASVACLFEYGFRESVLAQIIRSFCVFSIGIWVKITSFVLFLPTPFPSFRPNPDWDRHDDQNAHFLEALFGFMLTVNVGFLLAFYLLLAEYYRCGRNCMDSKAPIKCNYVRLRNSDTS